MNRRSSPDYDPEEYVKSAEELEDEYYLYLEEEWKEEKVYGMD